MNGRRPRLAAAGAVVIALAAHARATAESAPEAPPAVVRLVLAGATRAVVLFQGSTVPRAGDLPLALDREDYARIRHVWAWSPACPVTRVSPGEIAAFECPAAASSLEVVLSWPGKPSTELPAGELRAAPVEAWTEIPESLLPAWSADPAGRVRVPLTESYHRLRFAGESWGSVWRDVPRPTGRVDLAVEPAVDRELRVVTADGSTGLEGFLTLLRPVAARDEHRSFLAADPTGVIRARGLPAALELVVVATAPGTIPRRLRTRVADLPAEIRLAPGCDVVGRLVGERDEPLAGVDLRGEGYSGGEGGVLVRARAASGGDGSFRLGPLPRGEVAVALDRRGRASETLRFDLSGCRADHDVGAVVLPPAREIELAVHDDAGRPVPEAEIRTAGGERATTGPDGVAVLARTARNAGLALSVDAPGHLPWEGTIVPPLPREAAIELRRAAIVHGRFVTGDGTPPPSASVRVRQGTRFRDEEHAGDGTFLVELTPRAEAELDFRSPSTLRVVRRIPPLGPGEELDLGEVAAPPGWALTGRLLREDTLEPVVGARVWTPRIDSDGGSVAAWALGDVVSSTSGEGGFFRLAGMQHGPASLRVEARGLAPAEVEVLPDAETAGETDVGDVLLATGATVHVVGDLPDETVVRADWKSDWREMDMIRASAIGGEAWLREVPAGPVLVTAIHGRELLCERRVEVPENGQVVVECGGGSLRVTGTVYAGGRPDGPGSLVWLSGDVTEGLILHHRSELGATESLVYGGGRPEVEVEVAPDGSFATDALAAGSWQILWRPDRGGTSRPRNAELPGTGEVELQLEFAAEALAGVVVDAAAEPVAGARVDLLGAAASSRTDAGGRFSFVDLEPGMHRVQAHEGDRRSAVASVELEPGRGADPVVLTLGDTQPDRILVAVLVDDRAATAGLVFVAGDGGELRVTGLDGSGTAEMDWPPPRPHRVRAAAIVDGRLALGSWMAAAEAFGDGIVLASEESCSLELTGDGDGVPVGIVGPGGWDVSSLLAQLGVRTVVSPDRPLALSGLPAGRYRIVHGDLARLVDVSVGPASQVDLER